MEFNFFSDCRFFINSSSINFVLLPFYYYLLFQDSLFRDMKYLTSWTIRFYIIALMGIVISLSVGEEYVEAFLLMFTASFMTMVCL